MAAEFLARALDLFCIAIAPTVAQVEPPPPSTGYTVLAGALHLVPVGLAYLLYRRVRTVEAIAQLVAWPLTVIALDVAAASYAGASAPLLKGYYVAAAFVWISLALSMATVAGEFLGPRFKNRKYFGAIATLGAGVLILKFSASYIADTSKKWAPPRAAPASPEAAVGDPRKHFDLLSLDVLDKCVADAQSTPPCGCLARRAIVLLRVHDLPGAVADVKRAEALACALDAGDVTVRTVAAEVYATNGDKADAERMLTTDARATDPFLLYADALLHAAANDPTGAEELVKKAIAAGAGRNAELELALLLSQRSARDEARTTLAKMVAADPKDGDALYNLALLDDYVDNFNGAREGYLRALAADPKQRNARYNLALLTFRRGVAAEAKHHAAAFVKAFPDDPRGPSLMKTVGAVPTD